MTLDAPPPDAPMVAADVPVAGLSQSFGSEAGVPQEPANDGPLSHIPLLARLKTREQQDLFASMRVQAVDANQAVFWRSDVGDSLYLISKGQVEVTVPNEQGEHVTLDVLGPGGFFGEISLLDGGPRTATVRASQASELYVLNQSDFHAFLRQRPEAAIEILTVMGRRQRLSTEALRSMRNPNIAFERTRVGHWQRASDLIAMVAASQWFTIFHIAWFGGWILLNLLASWNWLPRTWAFDPFPFGLLTMVVSLEAIFLSIFVLVSQNRQSEKDRLRTELDYQVNLKAQTEILMLARKIDRLEAHLLGEEDKVERRT